MEDRENKNKTDVSFKVKTDAQTIKDVVDGIAEWIKDCHDHKNPGPKLMDGCEEDTGQHVKRGVRKGVGKIHGPCGTKKDDKRVFLCDDCCDRLGIPPENKKK